MANITEKQLIEKGTKIRGYLKAQVAKGSVGIAMLALLGVGLFMAYSFILPYLVDVVWGTVELIVGGIIALVLLAFTISNVKNFTTFVEIVTDKIFGGLITMAPFLMQEKQIKQAEEDYEKLQIEKAKIEGKYYELSQKIAKNQKEFDLGKEEERIALANNDKESAAKAVGRWNRAYRYIQAIGPIADNMKFIIDFVRDGSKILKNKIAEAKADLLQSKDIFESAKTGAAALNRMKAAMVGDVELNTDSERAQMEVMKQIAISVGQMRTSMEIISEVTKSDNLENAAKLSLAKKQLEELNITKASDIPVPIGNMAFKNIQAIGDSSSQFPIE